MRIQKGTGRTLKAGTPFNIYKYLKRQYNLTGDKFCADIQSAHTHPNHTDVAETYSSSAIHSFELLKHNLKMCPLGCPSSFCGLSGTTTKA